MRIIAELGSNFTDYDSMKNAISLAKKAGADAIKFQWFSHNDMYGYGDITPNFPDEWVPLLVGECKRLGIEFICTIFNHALVKFLNPHVKTFKVASSDMVYKELLQEINETGKDVLLSTGAASLAEIEGALEYLTDCKVTIMFCRSSYPARDINPRDISFMIGWFRDYDIGLSDHSREIYSIPYYAKHVHNCKVLEKHFNPHELESSPDATHSLTFNEFRQMVQNIRGENNASLSAKESEKDMLLKHRRRLVAIKPIKKGQRLHKFVNFGPYRTKHNDSFGGHSLFFKYDGKIADRDYVLGEGIFFKTLR